MKELSIETIKSLLGESYTLCYVDYRDSLYNSLDTIENCIENQNGESLFEKVDSWFIHNQESNVKDIVNGIKQRIIKMGYPLEIIEIFFEEHESVIENLIYERDDSNPLKDLIRNTPDIPVRIELLSNYDCINSHYLESYSGYSYFESYFGDMVDSLNLNPSKVKKILESKGEKTNGIFPSKVYRNGNELVSYEEFYEELINSCCGANLLVFTGMINVSELYDNDFKTKKIIIPKGNYCGLFSSFQGGGSILDMTLKKDHIIYPFKNRKKYGGYRIELDYRKGNYGYSIIDTYGMDKSFFKNRIQLVS